MFGMRRMRMGHRPNRNRRRQNIPVSSSKVCEESEQNSDACKRLAKSFCVGSSQNPSPFAMFVQLHAQESSQELADLFESLNKVCCCCCCYMGIHAIRYIPIMRP